MMIIQVFKTQPNVYYEQYSENQLETSTIIRPSIEIKLARMREIEANANTHTYTNAILIGCKQARERERRRLDF